VTAVKFPDISRFSRQVVTRIILQVPMHHSVIILPLI